ncbi:Xanthine dehydrogenase [Coccomyxa sp. Obi]|nr:Xanthine dehydrogenase [Coccomyxa sp. Obi]
METSPVAYINGKKHTLPLGKAEVTLLQYLRGLGLTGTKLGCGEGGCGACTVMVSSWDEGKICHRSINACLCPLYAIEGMHVVTVEGIGNVRDGLHPVQERLARAHGSQCGFCTPGFVMSMYSLLRSKPEAPTETEIEETLAGNLCRCTGYRPILDAFRVFAKGDSAAYTEEAIAASKAAGKTNGRAHTNGSSNGAHPENGHTKSSCNDGHDGCNGKTNGSATTTDGKSNGQSVKTNGRICPSSGLPCDCGAAAAVEPGAEVATDSDDKLVIGGSKVSTRPTTEPIFPSELKTRVPPPLELPGPLATWFRPVDMKGLLAVKAAHPAAKLVVGNSEVGIEMKFKNAGYPILVGTTHVPELNQITVSESCIEVGASVTLTKLGEALKQLVAALPAHQTSTFTAMLEQLKYFAGVQIRNAASVGGNIVTGSPISDLNPIYMAAGAVFTVVGQGTPERQVRAEDFFLGYRKVDLQPHEVLARVAIPFTRLHEYVREFKQAHRRDDDIAIVNAGMRMLLSRALSGEWTVEEVGVAYGGVAPKTIMARRVEAALKGQPLTQATLEKALAAVAEDVNITPNAPGGMVEFRRSLAASFLFRFVVDVALRLRAEAPEAGGWLPAGHESAAVRFERPPSRGIQYFSKAGDADVVGQPERHMAADLQVTGEAQYTDDVPLPPNVLHAALVTSTRPHAKILSVDASAAEQARPRPLDSSVASNCHLEWPVF